MNRNWITSSIYRAQDLCLGDGARVPGAVRVGMESVLESVSVIHMNKDFITHEPGGSDG